MLLKVLNNSKILEQFVCALAGQIRDLIPVLTLTVVCLTGVWPLCGITSQKTVIYTPPL